jgi:hypothetical protein
VTFVFLATWSDVKIAQLIRDGSRHKLQTCGWRKSQQFDSACWACVDRLHSVHMRKSLKWIFQLFFSTIDWKITILWKFWWRWVVLNAHAFPSDCSMSLHVLVRSDKFTYENYSYDISLRTVQTTTDCYTCLLWERGLFCSAVSLCG